MTCWAHPGRVIGELHGVGHHGVELLVAEVGRAELVELVVEPGRVHQLDLPDAWATAARVLPLKAISAWSSAAAFATPPVPTQSGTRPR